MYHFWILLIFIIAVDSKSPPKEDETFDNLARMNQKHGGVFIDAIGKLENKGVACLKQCRRNHAGIGSCPSFCGPAGACCRSGHGLDDESCEYGKHTHTHTTSEFTNSIFQVRAA